MGGKRFIRITEGTGVIGTVDEESYIARSPYEKGKAFWKLRPKHKEDWVKPAVTEAQNERLKRVNARVSEVLTCEDKCRILEERFAAFCAENGEYLPPRGKKQTRRKRSKADFLRSELMRGETAYD